jgi:hypothetical protein
MFRKIFFASLVALGLVGAGCRAGVKAGPVHAGAGAHVDH